MEQLKFSPNKYSRRIPYTYARSNKVCIYAADAEFVHIATSVNLNPLVITEIKRKVNQPIKIERIEEKLFDAIIAEAYSSANAAAVVDDIQDDIDISDLMQNLQKTEDLLESENDAPVIKIINAFLTQAVKEDASDVHLDAYEHTSLVRFRRDGVLHKIIDVNRGLHAALVSRIKIMAQLDIAEKRLPQDGRIALRLAGREVDLRVSTIPTGHGERIVMRLLDKNKERLQLETLGMAPDTLGKIDKLISRPHGIFLVTGPTGSGKSTTLYAALARIDSNALNIMTVEDPVEYDITGISQTQVNAKIDMTFARALRSILRQDPDVVMIGEIRDLETAEIAVQSSLTGHLVLATLHTNSASSTVTRMIDMGVESFLLSSTLIGILAQRLIRLLCPRCKEENTSMDAETRAHYEIPDDIKIYKAVGCDHCSGTGYKGRTGIHELLVVDEEVQRLIHTNASETEIEKYAIKKLGMRTLRMDGLRWLRDGKTTIEEIISITKE
ncbi:MAG TPA: type II secretion system ATPase GspE [Burkholderiales bacterium]|nr:type II secretion system ATPase GspE [Burkholderiales bacterium]